MKVSLDSYTPQDRKSVADVRYVVRYMIEKWENQTERQKFRCGVNATDLRKCFVLVKHYELGTYRNRCRDNVYLKYFGWHEVNGLKHWFPLDLDEKGLIDHSRCNCPRKP